MGTINFEKVEKIRPLTILNLYFGSQAIVARASLQRYVISHRRNYLWPFLETHTIRHGDRSRRRHQQGCRLLRLALRYRYLALVSSSLSPSLSLLPLSPSPPRASQSPLPSTTHAAAATLSTLAIILFNCALASLPLLVVRLGAYF